MFHTVVKASTNYCDIDRFELIRNCPRYLLQTFRGSSDKEVADVPETLRVLTMITDIKGTRTFKLC